MQIKISAEKFRKATLSQRADEMQASPIRRLGPLADAAKKRGVKVYHLNIGQPDIITPPEIMAAVSGYKEEVLAYGPSQGLLSLREEIARYFAKHEISLSPDEIMITTGGSEAIMFALMAIGDPGDEVLIPEPFYTNYNGFASMAAVKLIPVPTYAETGFALPEREEFERRITPRTRAILYCSPNNPTGAILNRSNVEMLAELAVENNLWLLADEVYREFTYDGKSHTSVLSFPEITDRAVMLDSISKRFSACGARIGLMASRNKEIMTAALKLGQARLCPPTIEQMGAIAGYQALDRFLPRMISEYQLRRDIVCEELAKIPGAVSSKPAGAFYIMPKLPIDDANSFASWLLTDFSLDGSTVMVAPGDGFYATSDKGKQEIRIAYVLKEKDLRQAMQILVKAVESYNSRKEEKPKSPAFSINLSPQRGMNLEQFARTAAEDPILFQPISKAASAIPSRALQGAESEDEAALSVVFEIAKHIFKEIGLPWQHESKKYSDLWHDKFRPWIVGQQKTLGLNPYAVESAGNAFRRELEALKDRESQQAWERFEEALIS